MKLVWNGKFNDIDWDATLASRLRDHLCTLCKNAYLIYYIRNENQAASTGNEAHSHLRLAYNDENVHTHASGGSSSSAISCSPSFFGVRKKT